VLAGYAFDLAPLRSGLPGFVAMVPNTAVCFILAGVALACLRARFIPMAVAGSQGTAAMRV